MIYILMFFSFSFAAMLSVLVFKRKHNKWLGLLTALCINVLILVTATAVMYSTNDEIRLFGLGDSGIGMLIYAILPVTWLNFIMLEIVKRRKI